MASTNSNRQWLINAGNNSQQTPSSGTRDWLIQAGQTEEALALDLPTVDRSKRAPQTPDYSAVLSALNDRIINWSNSYNQYLTDNNARYANRTGQEWVGDSAAWVVNNKKRTDELRQSLKGISDDANSAWRQGMIDSASLGSIKKLMDDFETSANEMTRAAQKDADYFSQWKDENEFKLAQDWAAAADDPTDFDILEYQDYADKALEKYRSVVEQKGAEADASGNRLEGASYAMQKLMPSSWADLYNAGDPEMESSYDEYVQAQSRVNYLQHVQQQKRIEGMDLDKTRSRLKEIELEIGRLDDLAMSANADPDVNRRNQQMAILQERRTALEEEQKQLQDDYNLANRQTYDEEANQFVSSLPEGVFEEFAKRYALGRLGGNLTAKETAVQYLMKELGLSRDEVQSAYDYMTWVMNARATEAVSGFVEDVAGSDGFWGALGSIGASVASVPIHLMQGVERVSQVGQVAKNAWNNSNRPVDTRTPTSQLRNITETARGAVQQKILKSGTTEDENGRKTVSIGAKIGNFAYNTAMSAADSAASSAVAGAVATAVGGPIGLGAAAVKHLTAGLTSLIIGSQVASEYTAKAIEEGMSAGEALFMGSVSGAIEGISEAVSVEAIISQISQGNTGILVRLGKSAASEGGEELEANYMGRLAEIIEYHITGHEGEFVKSFKENQRRTGNDVLAFAMTCRDFIPEDLESVVAGAISGGLIFGSQSVIQRQSVSQILKDEGFKKMYADIKAGNTDSIKDVIRSAMEYGGEVAESAKWLQQQLDSGNTPSASSVATFVLETQQEGIRKVQEAVRENPELKKVIDILQEAQEQSQDTISPDATPEQIKEFGQRKFGMAGNLYAEGLQEGQDVVSYTSEWERAFELGQQGAEAVSFAEEIQKGNYTTATQEQLQAAYEAGKAMIPVETQNRRKAVAEVLGKNTGKLSFDGGTLSNGERLAPVSSATLRRLSRNENAKRDLDLLTTLSNALTGVKLALFESESYRGDDGVRRYTGTNGAWDAGTNTLYIAINGKSTRVSSNTSGLLAFVASHEITHLIERSNPEGWERLRKLADEKLSAVGESIDARARAAVEQSKTRRGEAITALVERGMSEADAVEAAPAVMSYDAAIHEIVARTFEESLSRSDLLTSLSEDLKTTDRGLWNKIRKWVRSFVAKVREWYTNNAVPEREAAEVHKWADELAKAWEVEAATAIRNKNAAVQTFAADIAEADTLDEIQTVAENAPTNDPAVEAEMSTILDEKLMEQAVKANKRDDIDLDAAAEARTRIKGIIQELGGSLNLPSEDLKKSQIGKTILGNKSYGYSVENMTVCIRTLIADYYKVYVEKALGRPLTVEESMYATQMIGEITGKPECYYCYVEADRKAFSEALGRFVSSEIAKVPRWFAEGKTVDDVIDLLSDRFEHGPRKKSDAIKKRVNDWYRQWKNGRTDWLEMSDVAGLLNNKDAVAQRMKELPANKRADLKLAVNYAKSASHAKDRVYFTPYAGEILNKLKDGDVETLNANFGLRMYSYSDFSPAFILENMQMITDAAVKGLKVLAYTKEPDFVKIFAPTGANIEISVFAYEQNGQVEQDAMMGMSWEEAQAFRKQYPNVGITFVATSENIRDWAEKQDWVDVVLPYHSVFSGGGIVARIIGAKDWKAVQEDRKIARDWKNGKYQHTSIAPPIHQNDLIKYADALIENHLTPRFAEYLKGFKDYRDGNITAEQFREMNPYYMKYVNETRRSAADTPPVKPVFGVDDAEASLRQLAREGGFNADPLVDVEDREAFGDEIAEGIRRGEKFQRTGDSVEYSELEYYKYNIDSWDSDGRPDGEVFYVGLTSDVLQALGAHENYIYIQSEKINKIMGEHQEITLDQIKMIPNVLDNPSLILKSRTRPDSVVVFDDVLAENQMPYAVFLSLVASEPDKAGDYIALEGLQKVTSVYTKAPDEVKYWVTHSQVLYADKKRATRSLRQLGILAARTTTSSDYIGSISERTRVVNGKQIKIPVISGKNFSEVFTEVEPEHSTLSDEAASDEDILMTASADLMENDPALRGAVLRWQEKAQKLQQISDQIDAQQAILDDAKASAEDKVAATNRINRLTRQYVNQRESLAQTENNPKLRDLIAEERRLGLDRMTDEQRKQFNADYTRLRDALRSAEKTAHGEGVDLRAQQRQIDSLVRQRNEQAARAERAKQSHRNYVERQSARALRQSITDKVTAFQTALAENSDRHHVPELLKGPLKQFLATFSTVTQPTQRTYADEERNTKAQERFAQRMSDYTAAWDALERALNSGAVEAEGSLDIPQDLTVDIREHLAAMRLLLNERAAEAQAAGVEGSVIGNMSVAELSRLNKMLAALRHIILEANRRFYDAQFETPEGTAKDTMREMVGRHSIKDINIQLPGRFAEKLGKDALSLRDLLTTDTATPINMFERMGKGGQSIFKGLQNGTNTLTRLVVEVIDKSHTLWKPSQIRAWERQMVETQVSDIETGKAMTVRMTVAEAMSLYELYQREAAQKHLSLGGFVVPMARQRGIVRTDSSNEVIRVGIDGISKIIAQLSDEQKSVADAIEKYMAERGTELINEISKRRFGYKFIQPGDRYFPMMVKGSTINVSDEDLTKRSNRKSLYSIINMSFTNRLSENADQPLVLNSIFDVYTSHMVDVAKYNALSLPMLDALRWFNWREKTTSATGKSVTYSSVKDSITSAYGASAVRYIETFLSDINGALSSVDDSGFAKFSKRMLSSFKAAQVAANLRVALLQPVSYVRAAYVLKPQYLALGAAKGAVQLRKAAQECIDTCEIAAWKDLGFYNLNLTMPISDMIRQDGALVDKIREKSMGLAELGDKLTWGVIWTAVKEQVKAEGKYKTDTDYINACKDLFEEVIYKTQVVDSVMTRSQVMRNQSVWAKLSTAFMAEPTISYNLVMQSVERMVSDRQKYGAKGAWRRNGRNFIVGTGTYVASAVAAALVEAAFDYYRDDDDDKNAETYLKYFGQNTALNLSFTNKLPLLREVVSILQGYEQNSPVGQGASELIKAGTILIEWLRVGMHLKDSEGQPYEWTKATYYGNMTDYGKVAKLIKAVSLLSGLPFYNAMREVVSAWNLVSKISGGEIQPIKTYEQGYGKKSKYDYQAYEAYKAGNQGAFNLLFAQLVDEYKTKGKNAEDAEDLAFSAINKLISSDYVSGGISSGAAMDAFAIIGGKEPDDAYWRVKELDVTGGKSDIDFSRYDRILAAITAKDEKEVQAATKELVTHGTKEDSISSAITRYLSQQYLDGELTEDELTDLYLFAGRDEDEAYWKARQLDTTGGDSDIEWSKYDKLTTALTDHNRSAYRSAFDELTSHGVSESSVKSAVSRYVSQKYLDKEITSTEARSLLSFSGMDDNDIYWKIKQLDSTGGNPDIEWTKYDRIKDALVKKNGSGFRAAFAELTSHGVEESTVKNNVNGYISDMYLDHSVSASEAKALYQFAGMSEDDAYWRIRELDITHGSSKVKFSRYDDMRAALASDTPSAYAKAVNELVSHGTKQDSVDTQTSTYIGELYKGGMISREQAIHLLQTYLGRNDKSAEATVKRWDTASTGD